MVRERARAWWLVPVLTSVAVALWQTAGVWGPGPVAGDDTMAQVVRNDHGLDLLAAGKLDGWFPRFMLGHQLFLFFGPGFTMLLGVLKLATFGLISTAGAYKAIGVLAIAGLGPAVLFLARSLGLRRAEAAAAAVLVLAVNNPFGLGLHGTYVIGLVPHQVAAVFFCLALGSLARTVEDGRRRFMVLGAASLAVVALVHPITALVLVVFVAFAMATVLAQRALSWRASGRLLVTGAAGLGLSAFWALPFVVHRDLQGPVTAWATPPLDDRLADLASGAILWPTGVFVLAVAGAGACLLLALRPDRPWMPFLALGPAGYLALAHLVADRVDGAVSLQLANRGLGYAGLLAMVGAGVALGTAARHLTVLDGRSGPAHAVPIEPAGGWTWMVALCAFAAAVVVAASFDGRGVATTAGPVAPELAAVADVLAEVVPDAGRFATERDFPAEIAATGTVHPDLWLVAASGRNTLNLFNPESSPTDAGFAVERLGRERTAVSAAVLARYGVTHVVTVRPDTSRLLADAEEFTRVADERPLAVFEVSPSGRSPSAMVWPVDPRRELEAKVVSWAPERVVMDVDVEAGAGDPVPATVALSWSPKWRGQIDGKPVALSRDDHGVLTVALPEGSHRFVLTFGPDRWDRLGAAVSVATVLAAAAYSVSFRSRRRSRTA